MKSVEKGLRKPPSFLSLINPFIEISSPESSKAVLLRKSLDSIVKAKDPFFEKTIRILP